MLRVNFCYNLSSKCHVLFLLLDVLHQVLKPLFKHRLLFSLLCVTHFTVVCCPSDICVLYCFRWHYVEWRMECFLALKCPDCVFECRLDIVNANFRPKMGIFIEIYEKFESYSYDFHKYIKRTTDSGTECAWQTVYIEIDRIPNRKRTIYTFLLWLR